MVGFLRIDEQPNKYAEYRLAKEANSGPGLTSNDEILLEEGSTQKALKLEIYNKENDYVESLSGLPSQGRQCTSR